MHKIHGILLFIALLLLPVSVFAENGGAGGAVESGSTVEAGGTARVSFLGPAGTYTEEAAQFWFQEGEELVPKETVNDAVEDLLSGNADFAVIPQENTVGGAVANYIDELIAAEDTYVVGEVVLPISQTLMGVPGTKLEDIKTVCSHAQGLAQSAEWRAENLPGAEAKEMDSTAAAASYVAEQQDPSIAAVAAPGAAPLYGLEVLAENVQITDANKTRFYVLSKAPLEDEELSRAAFVVTCEAGDLEETILAMHKEGLELVSIHDRPEGSQLGMYHYVMEVESEIEVSKAQIQAICGLDGVRFLGSFDAEEKQSTEDDLEEDTEDDDIDGDDIDGDDIDDDDIDYDIEEDVEEEVKPAA